MENTKNIVQPHLNAEIYRTDTTGTTTLSYLDYIRLHSDGTVLIGCSELTGRYWNAGVNIFKSDVDSEQFNSDAKKNIYLTSGTADGCFVENSNRVLLCEDSGALSIWKTNDDVWQQWNEELSVAEHDDAVLVVDCLNIGHEYITASADGNVKVWDIGEMICTRNYSAAHTMAVNTVSVKPQSTTNFVTGSQDQYISLWDENVSKSVCDVLKNDCGIRCLQWLDEHRLVFGDDAGVLRLTDLRKPGESLKLLEFPAAVHRLAVQTESKYIGICCDNKIVTVCDIADDSNIKTVYSDRTMHENFVRGLAWDVTAKNILHAVDWSGNYKKHVCS